ncbi:MAG: 2-amino-4-hydroxy-6-hydroxymethyldihydropteridine diphosphokinase [Methylococcales bacterium]
MSIETVAAYIGLGSNLSDPIGQVKNARIAIQHLDRVKETGFSSLYRSAPMGSPDQPEYVNAVMGILTTLSAMQLLSAMQAIENQQGRVRTEERWDSRTLDLDLLLYGQQAIDTKVLIVPHYGMAKRPFVLYPLSEIAPDMVIPGKGDLVGLLKQCPPEGLAQIDS